MKHTLVEKLLLHYSGSDETYPGELIRVQPTIIPSSHYSINNIIRSFKRSGMKTLGNKENIVIINNASPVDSAHQSKDTFLLQKFVEDFEIEHYFELGRSGVPSVVLIENGFVTPGTLAISAENSFYELGVFGTYTIRNSPNEIALSWATNEQWVKVPESIEIIVNGKLGQWITGVDVALHILKNFEIHNEEHLVIEIKGPGLENIPINERFNIARIISDFTQHAVIFESDQAIIEYLQDTTDREGDFFYSDDDANFKNSYELNLNIVQPMLAVAIDNGTIEYKTLLEMTDKSIDKIFMGACGSGRYDDIKMGVKSIGYKQIHSKIQSIVMPASNRVWEDLIADGFLGMLIELGYEIYPASYFRILTESVGIYINNINVLTSSSQLFLSAMETHGHNIMLGNILTTFTAATTGKITHPAEFHEDNKDH